MQYPSSLFLILTSMSFCSNSSSTTQEDSSSGFFSCEDYQIMLDVEVTLAVECSNSQQCQQILVEGEMECEANSIIANENFDSEYFYSLYDEAMDAGCISIDLPMNQDCGNTEPACVNSECVWQ